MWCILHLILYTPNPFLTSCIVIWRYPVYWICFHPWWFILVLIICNNECGCVLFFICPWCRCWGFQVGRKFHPWICGSLVRIVMFDLHPFLCCIVVGDSWVVVFCLSISDNLLMDCNILSLMDKKWGCWCWVYNRFY